MPTPKPRGSGRTVRSRTTLALVTLAFLAFVPQRAGAQTGVVTGTVKDDEGHPIPDATVVIPERQIGARSNAEGRYTIPNVPVGSWLVRAVIAGKKPSLRTALVDAGRTAVADFTLIDEPYRMGGIVVHGRREMAIRKDPETKTYVTGEQLRSLPFGDYREHIELKAGVMSLKGELHFRAGRSDEILTVVNGIPSRNPLVAQGVELGILALSGTEQIMGGMDAQYGNALSGIIALTTREGGDKFGGEVRYFTDRYGEADKSFLDFERLSVGFGGPLLTSKTRYYVSFQGTYTDTYLRSAATHREHRFLDFIRIGNKQSNATNLSGKVTWSVTPSQKLSLELIRNASLTGRFHNRWNRKGYVQLFSDSTAPTDGSITSRYGAWAWYPVDSTYVPMNTAEHLPIRNDDYAQLSLAWRHSLGRDLAPTIYNLRLSRQEWRSTTDVLDRQPWEYQQEPNQYYDPTNQIDGSYYATNGDYPFYERRRSATYTMNGDVTKDVRQHHLMAGGEFRQNDLEYLLAHYPNVLASNGNYGAPRDEFRTFNPEGSFFIQDRWQHEGMVLNAGIRYDNFAIGSQIPRDEVRHPVKTQWSPRIGVAYPISERDVMSFHYGRLFQMPDRLYIYQGRKLSAEVRGNPDLDPETTISYQLGLQHLFSKEIYVQFSVYFKDTFGLLTTVEQEVPGLAVTATTRVNGDYATARGADVTLIKQFSHGFSGEVNYSYGNASGTASDPNRALPSSGNLRDQFHQTTERPLEWDQRHNLSATLRLSDERSWGASFVYQFGTGIPYTPEQRQQRRQDPTVINSGRLPPTSSLSLQAERYFKVWGQRMTVYLQGTNLLDAKGISELQPSLWPNNNQVNASSYVVYYTETGRAGGAILTADQDGDGREDWVPVNDPRVFQQGRVIRVGLGVEF
jgi:outer membrane receptor for ferrienterochelin and colicin